MASGQAAISFGVATFATLQSTPEIEGLAISGNGTVYAPFGNSIQSIAADGSTALLAGGTAPGSADGAGPAAQFDSPVGICLDGAGNLYVADSGNNCVRKVTPAGTVTTVAGLSKGLADGMGVNAQFNAPTGVALDPRGDILVADTGNNLLRKIAPDGTTTTLYSGASIVDAAEASGYTINSVACDGRGDVFLGATSQTFTPYLRPETVNNLVIWEITAEGVGELIFSGNSTNYDELGPFSAPYAPLAVDSAGNVYTAVANQAFFIASGQTGATSASAPSVNLAGDLFNFCGPMACDPKDRAYLADNGNESIIDQLIPDGEPPSITTQPRGGTLAFGQSVTLAVSATGLGPLSYQWESSGTPIAGATSPTLTTDLPGSYSVVITNLVGSVTSQASVVTTPSRLSNISTRAEVGTGANILIGGFIVDGNPGVEEVVLIRGVGPGLKAYDVNGALKATAITLYDSTGAAVATNAGWNTNSDAENIVAAEASVGAFALALDSLDSALLVSLEPGSYTVQVQGVGGSTGVALVEVYEYNAGYSELVNVSSRCFVSTGTDIAIAGFVVTGSEPVPVLLRGAGPALAGYGVAGYLAAPTVALYDSSGAVIGTEGEWGSVPVSGSSALTASIRQATAADMQRAGAFSFAAGSADSAMVATLPPGSYTLQLSGLGGASGVGLVEVYQLP